MKKKKVKNTVIVVVMSKIRDQNYSHIILIDGTTGVVSDAFYRTCIGFKRTYMRYYYARHA